MTGLIHPSGTTPKRVTGGVEYMTDDLNGGINVSHFLVRPKARREGRGAEVMGRLVREAREMGYEYVVVNMGGGDAAERFLRSLGFLIVEREGDRMTAEMEIGPAHEFGPV